MDNDNTPAREREAQWNAFHRWEASHRDAPSVEERISWYCAAFRFARDHSSTFDESSFREKTERIGKIRERLSRITHARP